LEDELRGQSHYLISQFFFRFKYDSSPHNYNIFWFQYVSIMSLQIQKLLFIVSDVIRSTIKSHHMANKPTLGIFFLLGT